MPRTFWPMPGMPSIGREPPNGDEPVAILMRTGISCGFPDKMRAKQDGFLRGIIGQFFPARCDRLSRVVAEDRHQAGFHHLERVVHQVRAKGGGDPAVLPVFQSGHAGRMGCQVAYAQAGNNLVARCDRLEQAFLKNRQDAIGDRSGHEPDRAFAEVQNSSSVSGPGAGHWGRLASSFHRSCVSAGRCDRHADASGRRCRCLRGILGSGPAAMRALLSRSVRVGVSRWDFLANVPWSFPQGPIPMSENGHTVEAWQVWNTAKFCRSCTFGMTTYAGRYWTRAGEAVQLGANEWKGTGIDGRGNRCRHS